MIWDRIIQNPLPALRQFIKWEETREAEKFVLTSQLQSLFPWTELVMLPPVHTQGYHTRGETIKDITVSQWQSPSDRVRVKSVSPCDSSRVWVRLTGGVSWSAFDWATPKPHVSHPLLSPLTLGNFHADHEQSLSTMSSKDKILGLLPVTTNQLPHPLLNHPHHRPHSDQISIKLDRKWSGGSPGSGSQTQGLRLSCESFHFQPLARKPSSYFFFPLVTSSRFRSKCFWAHPVYQCPLVSAQSLLSR